MMKSWKNWNFPTKIGVVGSAASVAGIILYFIGNSSELQSVNLSSEGKCSPNVSNNSGSVSLDCSTKVFSGNSHSLAENQDNRDDIVRSVFPFRIGATWVYSTGKLTTSGSSPDVKVLTELGRYSETVTAIDSALSPQVTLVGISRQGDAPDMAPCSGSRSDIPGDPDFWYVSDSHGIAYACSRTEAVDLASDLIMRSDGNNMLYDYQLPLAIGSTWEAYPDIPPREGTLYQWHVESKGDAKVPAGRFSGCFKLMYEALPDHEIRWICPGIGLVAQESNHHGTIEQSRSELVSFNASIVR